MEYLSAYEKTQLEKILSKVDSLATFEKRKNFLGFCGLKEYTNNLPMGSQNIQDFIIGLICEFQTRHVSIEGCHKRILTIFLTYIVEGADSYLTNENDIKFINIIIVKSEWSSLLEDSRLTPLYKLIEKLKIISDACKFSQEKCLNIINIFRQISSSLQDESSFVELLIESKQELKKIDNDIGRSVDEFLDKSIEMETKNGCKIPIVLVVMNEKEAKDLDSGKAFCDYHDRSRKNFNRLKEELTKKGIINWVAHYQDAPEHWKPFNQACSQIDIDQLINEAFMEIQYEQKIVPEFINIRDLNQDNKPNIKQLKKMRNNGCMVIMDAISMQHPEIQRLFRRAALDAFPNTLVVMVAPFYSIFDVVRKIESIIKQRIDIDFYRRLELNDSKCSKVADNTGFRTWLINQAPYLLPESGKEKEDVRDFMFN